MSPTIQLKLFATLAPYLPDQADRFAITTGETVDSIVQRLGLPDKLVKLIFVNGVIVNRSTKLEGGERVGIFPPVGGG